MLVDAFRCLNEGWLPRIVHCLSLSVNGALLLCAVVTGTRQRGKWYTLVLCSCVTLHFLVFILPLINSILLYCFVG